MTGGDVAMSTLAELVFIQGRVSSVGVKVAPIPPGGSATNGIGLWTVANSTTGVQVITFAQSYPQYVGTTFGIEGATASAITGVWDATAKTLTVTTNQISDGAATAIAFSFCTSFTESLAP